MKLSIKQKMTLWFSITMIVLSVFLFFLVAVVSDATITLDARHLLSEVVDGNAQEVEYDDGVLDIDEDFTSYERGVYCLILAGDGSIISGYAPHDALLQEPFDDSRIRKVSAGGESYFLRDRLILLENGDAVWLRGAVSSDKGAAGLSAMAKSALIILPLLILTASIVGYLLARRALSPISKIRATAEAISGSGDLTKRIEINGSGDELDRLSETFNAMFDRLETNFEAERQFTADASHELRNPVAIILAQCEYAFENASEKEELYETIGAVQKQGYRMSRLIDSLLAYTRLEQGTQQPSLTPTDLSRLVVSVCEEQREIPEKSISLISDIESGIFMQADPVLISRMLVNLIRNSYQYGRENGWIRFALSQSDSQPKGAILLEVADDGIGMDDEVISKIWNRFYRADKSRSREGGAGLGLGLTMVKKIVQLHGGQIEVSSSPGKGSRFRILFPASDSFEKNPTGRWEQTRSDG